MYIKHRLCGRWSIKRRNGTHGRPGPAVVLPIVVLLAVFLPGWVAASGEREQDAGRSTPSGGPADARIEYLEPGVTINGEAARIGQHVTPGSVVATDADGFVDIVFGRGNAIRVRSGTELTLDLTDLSRGLDVRRGSVAAVFEGLQSIGVGRNDTFRIHTPTTIAGVRGTVFFVLVENRDSTYVCTCHGELSFVEQELTIRAARHDAARFVRSGTTVLVEDAPEIYHDSDALNEVADVVGVTIAWGEEPR